LNYPGITMTARINRFTVSCNHASVYLPHGAHLHEYSVSTGRLRNKFTGHFERVVCCATNPATQDVYSAGVDRHILVWTPAMDERSYAAELEEEKAASAIERQNQLEAQDAADQEAQMRVMQPIRPAAAAAAALGPRPDEDAWSDED
jgi:hypothetical protein